MTKTILGFRTPWKYVSVRVGTRGVVFAMDDELAAVNISQSSDQILVPSSALKVDARGEQRRAFCFELLELFNEKHLLFILQELHHNLEWDFANGERMVKTRVEIEWTGDRWYSGTIAAYSPLSGKHHVHYDDGDKRWYAMASKNFRFEGDTAIQKVYCPSGHEATCGEATFHTCDLCGSRIPRDEAIVSCRLCNWDSCRACLPSGNSDIFSLPRLPESVDKWTCLSCTFLNTGQNSECVMCLHPIIFPKVET
jgi:hypothetical protein